MKLFHRIVLVLVILSILILNQLLPSKLRIRNIFRKTSIKTIQSNRQSRDKTTYKILLWTKYFSSDDWANLNLKELNCEYYNCILTKNRNDFDTSDAVLFHWWDIDWWDVPNYHLTDQKWVLLNHEPPKNCPPIEYLEPFGGHINWTLSYRYDSDIFSPYGEIFKCDKNLKTKYRFDEKKKSIAWFVSECYSESNRELYVKELQKYIDVDIFGKCGQLKCSKDKKCYEMIAKNYKFYLAFENSVSFLIILLLSIFSFLYNLVFPQQLCKDYVTEKFYRTVNYDIIPVSKEFLANLKISRRKFSINLSLNLKFYF
jgi:hypothetical protein